MAGKSSKTAKTTKGRKTRAAKAAVPEKAAGIPKKFYEQEMAKLQVELVKLQEWIRARGLKVVILFEGRDAAG